MSDFIFIRQTRRLITQRPRTNFNNSDSSLFDLEFNKCFAEKIVLGNFPNWFSSFLLLTSKYLASRLLANRPKAKQLLMPQFNSLSFEAPKMFFSSFSIEANGGERKKCIEFLDLNEDSFAIKSVSISNFYFSIARIHRRNPTSRFNFSYFSVLCSSKHHFVCHRAVIRFLIKNSSPNLTRAMTRDIPIY